MASAAAPDESAAAFADLALAATKVAEGMNALARAAQRISQTSSGAGAAAPAAAPSRKRVASVSKKGPVKKSARVVPTSDSVTEPIWKHHHGAVVQWCRTGGVLVLDDIPDGRTYVMTSAQLRSIADLRVQTLHIIGCQLSRLGSVSQFNSSLRVLKIISIHEFTGFNVSIVGLTVLEELTVTDCHLRALHDNIGEMRALKYLDVSDNFLTVLPSSVGQLDNLLSVDLTANYLMTTRESTPERVMSYFRGCRMLERIFCVYVREGHDGSKKNFGFDEEACARNLMRRRDSRATRDIVLCSLRKECLFPREIVCLIAAKAYGMTFDQARNVARAALDTDAQGST